METPQLQGHRYTSGVYLIAVLTFFTCIHAQDQVAPKITNEIDTLIGTKFPRGVEVEETTATTLQISASGTRPLMYIWTHDGVVLKNSTNDYLDVVNANDASSGSYQCRVENTYGSVLSLHFDVIVRALGEFESEASETVTSSEGGSAVLDLPTISHLTGALRFEWLLNGNPITINQDHYYETLSRDLILLDIPNNFNGHSYQARITHLLATGLKKSESHAFILDVSDSQTPVSPALVIGPKDVEVIADQGRSADFECVINASPNTVSFAWYKRSASDQSRSAISSANNWRLTIDDVTAADAGQYECEGTVSGGSAITDSALLTVYVKPTIQSSSEQHMVKDFQETFVLPCQVTGSPPPQVVWFFNGKNLSSQVEEGLEIFPNGTLAIASVDIPDSGVYQCFATNAGGEASSYTRLTVNSAKPELIESPSDQIVIEHADTELTCKVRGGPRPEVYWTKDSVNLTIGGRIRLTADQLLIGRVEMSDAGLYRCHAVNVKGSISATATITVIIKTQINLPPQNVSRVVSTDANLKCGVRKDPSVDVTWRWFFVKNPSSGEEEIISGTGNKNISPIGTLVITGVVGPDSGKYICRVYSTGGNDQRTAILNVIDRPEKPIINSVELYEEQPNSVIITWTLTYSGDTPITKFVIETRQDSSIVAANIFSDWVTKNNNVDPSLRSLIVDDLLPARYYRFRIIAVNSVGQSEPSDAAPAAEPIKMPSQPPGEEPRNLFCTQGNQREIRVRWEAPPELSWNGELEGYIVYYQIQGLDQTARAKNVSGRDTLQTTLTNLAYYKRYLVQVAAYNDKGPGVNTSAYQIRTLQGIPSEPPSDVRLDNINSTAVRAQWLPPPFRVINGVNAGYQIKIDIKGVFNREERAFYDANNPSGVQSYDIAKLRKFTEYNISIACVSGQGAGPFSPPMTIQTLEDIPGPVTGLTVDNVRDNSLRVNWGPPSEINGILKGYVITYYVKDDPSSTRQVERKPDATSNTLLDLLYETSYIITVQAKTNAGLGPASSTEIESGVPPELPGPPSNLYVSNIKARTVDLQFVQGDNGFTSVLLWIIQAKTENSEEWTEIYSINDPDAIQITVQNLRPHTQYRLRIVKENIVDKSEPSVPCDPFQTLPDVPGMPPTDVTPRAVSPTSIRIRWRQIPLTEWNSNFVGYKIFYRRWSRDVDVNETSAEDLLKVRNSTWSEVTLRDGSNIQEYTLTKLEEWLDYEIQMVSYNSVGSSRRSTSLFEKTYEDKPSGYPVDVEVTATSSTSIEVSWKPVPILSRNGPILGYKVKYTAKLSNSEPQFVTVEGADVSNVDLNDLRKFVFYDVQILAYNLIGDGVLSPMISRRTAGDVPGPPVIVYFPHVDETSATIHWQEPDEPNGFIREYRVSYKLREEPNSVFANNAVVKGSNVFEHTTNGLSAETYYEFRVEARTEDGWGEAAYVDVYTFSNRERPNPPTNVWIDRNVIMPRLMTVSWSPGDDNYGPIRNFTIQYKEKDGEWEIVDKTISAKVRSYNVTGLKPNTDYSFRVAATNDIGMSDFSDKNPTGKTDLDKPDGAPQNVGITAVKTDSLRVTWTAPPADTWNSDTLMAYRVQYRLEDVPSLRWEVTGGTELIVQGLEQGKKYVFQVQATNNRGGGPWSGAVTAYMEIAPLSPPGNVAIDSKKSTQIEISWRPPPPESTNGEFTGYKVSLWKSSPNSCGDQVVDEVDRLVPESPVLFENLKPYTYYCATVQALNIAGEGPGNVPVGMFTLEDYPGAPANMNFFNISLQELVVAWEPPVSPNGVIMHYDLEYFVSVQDGKTDITQQRIPGDSHEIHMQDLFAEQFYTFSLAASTTIGKGNATEASVYTGPQQGSPQSPVQLYASQKEEMIVLTWINQDEGYSPIHGYEIRAEEESKPNEWDLIQKKENPETRAEISRSLLKLNKNYRFRVRAVNMQGISPPSPPSIPLKPSIAAAKATPFHEEWWFLVIVALSSVILILLLITLLCFAEKRRSKEKMKRSTTNTTVMSDIQETSDDGFATMQSRQSRRSMGRAPKPQGNIYALSPPRPSPASITYSDDTPPPPITGAIGGAMKGPASDASSELSEKPSHLGDSSDDSSDSDDSSTNSIAKAPIPASPPPPAFSSHYNKGYTSSNGAVGASNSSDSQNNPSWRFQNTNNAYTYTDSEAESSHYAFSLNNGNIVVNNVAGARTPLSGFSSFV